MSTDAWKKLSTSEWKKWFGVVGRLLLAYALIFSPSVLAGQNEQAKDKPAGSKNKVEAQNSASQQKTSAQAPTKASANAEESESAVGQEKNSGDGNHEGIKVHGHWTIEVHNPDGTVATHRDFENSLQTSGGAFLTKLLGNLNNPFGGAAAIWMVTMGRNLTVTTPDVNRGPCNLSAGSSDVCMIAQTPASLGFPAFPIVCYGTAVTGCMGGTQYGLSVTPSAGTLTLSGSTNPNTGNDTIGTVQTVLITTPDGLNFKQSIITQFDLSSNPIKIVAGQAIAVTVVISFS